MGDLGIEMGLVKLLQRLIDGIYAAIIGVELLTRTALPVQCVVR